MTEIERVERGRALAVSVSPAAVCSAKGGPVRFGMPRNLNLPMVRIAGEDFDAMSDDDVTQMLRNAWADAL